MTPACQHLHVNRRTFPPGIHILYPCVDCVYRHTLPRDDNLVVIRESRLILEFLHLGIGLASLPSSHGGGRGGGEGGAPDVELAAFHVPILST